MSSDLYNRELAERMGDTPMTEQIEPGIWTGFLRGTGQAAMHAATRTLSGIDLLRSVGPIAEDLTTGGTEAQDRFFSIHDEIWGRAREHSTPNPQEIGIAAMVTGELLATLPMIFASPGATLAGIMGGESEELMRKGAPAREAGIVGAVQAAGMGLGIWVPILGRTLTQRALLGGAGFNVVQGVTTRGISADVLKDFPELAKMYGAFDPTYLTLDVLLGLGFGGMAHVSPAMRAQGAEAMARIQHWLRDGAEPGTMQALAAMRQAQHIAADSMPGVPREPKDAAFHVERTMEALERLARNEPPDVSAIPEPRMDPLPAEIQAEREQQLQELVEAAEQVRADEGLPPPPEPTQAPRPLVPEDLAAVPHQEQARAFGQALENRLLELKVNEQEAKANRALWEAFLQQASDKYGVRVADLLSGYGIDVRRMGKADLEQMMPEALQQPRIPDSALSAFPDMQETDGLIPLSRFSPDEQSAMRRAGIVKKGTTEDGGTFEGADVSALWKARKEAQERARGGTRESMLLEQGKAPTEQPKGGRERRRTAKPEEVAPGERLEMGLESYAGRTYHPVEVISKTAKRARVRFLEDVPLRGPKGTEQAVPLTALFREAPVERAPGETLFQSEARSQIVQTAKAIQARWYSELERQLSAANIKAAPAKGWKDYLKGLTGKGAVKADELKWSGLEEWLDLQEGRVTKEQVLEFLKKNGVRVEETVYGAKDVQKRDLNDPEITPAVNELSRLGFLADVSPDGHVIGFVTEPGSAFDGDIVHASEIRQLAREQRAEADSAEPSREVTPEEAAKLERAADLAQRIEAYWHGEEMPQRTEHQLGTGQRVEAGEVFQGNDGDFTGPGWVYRFDGAEYYIREGDGANRYRVPWMGAETAYPTKARAEQALWERIAEELQLPSARDQAERATKFSEYQLPGGENYREITLRLPEAPDDALPRGYSIKEQKRAENQVSAIDELTEELRTWQHERGYAPQSADELRMSLEAIERPRPAHRALDIEWLRNFEGRWEIASQKDRYPQYVLVRPDGSGRTLHVNTKDDAIREARRLLQAEGALEKMHFTSGHFPDTDVLAHVRFNERTDADGKRVLFIEEIQSDWAQKARKSREAQVEELAKDKKIPVEQAEKLVPKEAGFFHEEPVYVVYYETPKGRVDMGYGKTPEEARAAMDQGWTAILKDDAIKTRREPGVQKGAVPAGPFVGKTEQWSALVLKRMIRWAAEKGFERVAWTTGEQQVTRYQHALRKAVDSIDWKKTPDGVQLIGYKGKVQSLPESSQARLELLERRQQERGALPGHEHDEMLRLRGQQQHGRKTVVDTTQKETELSDAIGKAMADQIRNSPDQSGTIEGENLKIDDTGMAGFYERILPSVAKDVLKKLGGGKVGKVEINVRDESRAPIYRAEGRELPEMDDMADSARETYGGVEDFADGEPPMLGETRILIDGIPVDVEMIISKEGVHFAGIHEGETFDLFVPKDRFPQPSRFKQQNEALEAVDDAWRSEFFWNNIELLTGDVRAPKPLQQPGFDITPEMREKALTGMPLFQPKRGVIQIGKQTLIGLLEDADASSLIHESSHLWLKMTQDLAHRGTGTLQALDDWGKLANWLKIEGGEISRQAQEKFATSFERYLAEGKAPSEELRSVFQQFRDWLIAIYKQLANIAEDIPDDVRGVFDRMLASQKKDPAPKAEGPPLTDAEPPPPPGEAAAGGGPEALMDWRQQIAEMTGPQREIPKLPLSDPRVGEKVDVMLAHELGWAQIGGRRARADIDMSSGRPNFTEWIPKSEIWPDRPAKHLSEEKVRKAVAKARVGERLGSAEKQMVDYLVDKANERLADVEDMGGQQAWNEAATAAGDEGLEPSAANVKGTDLVARAAEKDELAVERAAQKYENDEAAFMAEMRRIVGEEEPEGAGAAGGREEAPDAAPGGEGGQGGQDPIRAAAERYVAENPEQLIPTGTDADGNTTYTRLADYLEAELQAAREAREDIRLIEAAASCLHGRA